jgi:hypothetical protein
VTPPAAPTAPAEETAAAAFAAFVAALTAMVCMTCNLYKRENTEKMTTSKGRGEDIFSRVRTANMKYKILTAAQS